jgi:hypothetical protein
MYEYLEYAKVALILGGLAAVVRYCYRIVMSDPTPPSQEDRCGW